MTSSNPGCLHTVLKLFGLAPKAPAQEGFPYRLRDDFLSPAEASFFHVLQKMAGEQLLICPKVSLAELFFVPRQQNAQAFQNRIDRKRVDFLLCHPKTLKPLLAIELDDASHQRADRVERDDFVNQVFAAAGLPLARVQARATYNTTDLAALFRDALRQDPPTAVGASHPEAAPPPATQAAANAPVAAPICPRCGAPMALRSARKGDHPGQMFYGCTNYPRCRAVLPAKG